MFSKCAAVYYNLDKYGIIISIHNYFCAYNRHKESFWIYIVRIFSLTHCAFPKYYENCVRNSGDEQKTNQQTRLKTQLGPLGHDNINDPKN